MIAPRSESWMAANHRYLQAALGVVRKRLELAIASMNAGVPAPADDAGIRAACAIEEQARQALSGPAALDVLCAAFGLTSFERGIVLLCAGVELDKAIADACLELQGDRVPTFALALATLPDIAWGPMSPDAPLRCWRIIDIGQGPTLSTRRLRIDEYVLHYLLGLSTMDERLFDLFAPVDEPAPITPSQRALAERVAALWSADTAADASPPVVSLCGRTPSTQRAVAAHAAAHCGLRLYAVDARDLPETSSERLSASRLWQRHAALTASALLIEVTSDASAARAAAFAERLRGVQLLAAPDPVRLRGRPVLRMDVGKPLAGEQRALWEHALGPRAEPLRDRVDAVLSQFDFGTDDILAVAAKLRARPDSRDHAREGRQLWEACRVQARPQLDHLAQHIDARAGWDDLILGPRPTQLLREVAVHVHQKTRVYQGWGFAAGSARGLGISALFAGPSGTGKTTAAEVLARELGLDLYRIDLSAVVSKYIGETEKNLRQVFDAAEDGGAILLFDEADAIFGKRSDVKDSHDRYANMEVSYLLQRMEAYRGLAILTTNLRDSLDTAFMRRIRFVIEFPFPSREQRAGIWARMFPADAPTRGLDMDKLARLNLTGGSIRNVVLGGAFLAAEQGEPIQMNHLQEAARTELAKLERPVPERDLKDWI